MTKVEGSPLRSGSNQKRKQNSEMGANEKGERKSGSFTVEGLFDYINESAASLAKVVAAQREKLQGSSEEGQSLPRKLSVRTSIKNKKGQHVRFVSEVEVYPLPDEEGKDAWLSRQGKWGSAPEHDEVWDGGDNKFRPTELSTSEFRTWLKKQKSSHFSSFQEMVAPLLWGSSKSLESEGSKRVEETDFEDGEELEVQIELVEAPESPESRKEKLKESRKSKEDKGKGKSDKGKDKERGSLPQRGRSLLQRLHSSKTSLSGSRRSNGSQRSSLGNQNSREELVDEVGQVYGHATNTLMAKKFEFASPVKIEAKDKDVLLQQSVWDKKLSKSQAAAAASAGKVLMLKSNTGRTFGAAVKRKISLKPMPDMRSPAGAGFSFPQLSRQRSKSKKKAPADIRTKDAGLHMRPHFIIIFFIIPLLLIGIDDLWPYLEHVWFVIRNPHKDILYTPDAQLRIPFLVKLIWPKIAQERWLKDTVQIGSYVLEMSGLIVVLQQMYDWVILFRVVRTKIRVRVAQSLSDSESEYSEYSDSQRKRSYAYLFKWQQPRPLHDIDEDVDDSDNDSLPSI